jgi:D-alanine-D-alanine ligase
MTPLSLVPEIAAHAGIDFGALVSWMLEDASCPR